MDATNYTDDSDFPRGPGDPDSYGYPEQRELEELDMIIWQAENEPKPLGLIRYIGEDKAIVQRQPFERDIWELGDEMSDHSDDQGYDYE